MVLREKTTDIVSHLFAEKGKETGVDRVVTRVKLNKQLINRGVAIDRGTIAKVHDLRGMLFEPMNEPYLAARRLRTTAR